MTTVTACRDQNHTSRLKRRSLLRLIPCDRDHTTDWHPLRAHKGQPAATSGIHEPDDVVKLLMVGADITMLCSALLRHGMDHLRVIEHGLLAWMEAHQYESVRKIQGSLSLVRCPNPEDFERGQYTRAVKSIQHVVMTGKEVWRFLSDE